MKFRVPVTRDVTETCNIIVEADTVEEAHETAIAEARNDAGGNAYCWQRDDCFNAEREPYIADPDADLDLVQGCEETISEAEGLAAIRDALTLLAVGITPAMHPGRRALIEAAQDYALTLAHELFDRTDQKLPPRSEFAQDSASDLEPDELQLVTDLNAVATNLGDWAAEQFQHGYTRDAVRCRIRDAAVATN